MKTISKILIATLATLALTTAATADAGKGQKLYVKKLKTACGMTGAKVAVKHTQDEWQEIQDEGKLKTEIKVICPKVEEKALKEKYINHYFDFFKEFASDSGNVPSC
jgi:hypothetical protein